MSGKVKLHQRVAVIGLGVFGSALARDLTRVGVQVLAIDKSIELVDKIADYVDHAVCLDAKDQEALEQNGIHRIDAAAVCIGESFQECAIITAQLLEMKVPRVLARANGETEVTILKRIGAHDVFFVEQEMGRHWATLLARPGALEDFEVSKSHSIVRIHPHDSWAGKRLDEVKLPKEFGITLLGTYQEDSFQLVTGPDMVIQPTSDLLVIGHNQDLDRYFASRLKEEKSDNIDTA